MNFQFPGSRLFGRTPEPPMLLQSPEVNPEMLIEEDNYFPMQRQERPVMQGFGSRDQFFQALVRDLFRVLSMWSQGLNSQGEPMCLIHAPGIAGGLPEWTPEGIRQPIQNVAMKPAIYLYPTKPTEVWIQLDPSIEVRIDIPRYFPDLGWRVMAYPDGDILDLQPELTDLLRIDATQAGMEYLNKVRKTGVYPYLYWDGAQIEQASPIIQSGWIVQPEIMADFLVDKLTAIGLSDQEQEDFMDYWVPKLSSLKAERFKIHFMLTDAVQAYLPFKVYPEPDVINRLLMLVEINPNANEAASLPEQPLTRFKRDEGFVLVEWGGMFVHSPNYQLPLNQVGNTRLLIK